MMQSTPEFDINELFQVAKSRWLKPLEIFFILQNYSKDQLTQKPPQNPPSGSLFLFDKKVVRFFRKDGYSWHKKKDGKTVGEAHERLKVRSVETLNCYYAHGDPNSGFQRRCYWILDPDLEHIVLVHYRDVNEGKHNAISIPKLLTDSNPCFNLSARFYDHPPRIGELSEALGVCDQFVVGNNETGQLATMSRSGDVHRTSGLELQALRKLSEQLSVEEDDNHFAEKLPPYCSQNENLQDSTVLAQESEVAKGDASRDLSCGLQFEDYDQWVYAGMHDDLQKILLLKPGDTENQHDPSLTEGCAIEKKGSLTWRDMLELSSSSTAIDSQEETSETFMLKGFPESSTCSELRVENGYGVKDAKSHDNHLSPSELVNISPNLVEQPENLTCQWPNYILEGADSMTTFCPASESNDNSQLPAARQFLLQTDSCILPTPSSELFQEFENPTSSAYSSGASNLGTDAALEILGKTSSIEWFDTGGMPVDSQQHTDNYHGMFINQESQFGTLKQDSSFTVSQILLFSVQEVSPEWAYCGEATKVIIIGDFLCKPSDCSWACMFGDIEVPLQIMRNGVLCCLAPQHAPGKVNLYITSGNKKACSQVREFEYRLKPRTSALDDDLLQARTTKSLEELQLLARFLEMLLLGNDGSSVMKDGNVRLDTRTTKSGTSDNTWEQIREAFSAGTPALCSIMDLLLQELLKDKLQQWLSSKSLAVEGVGCARSKQQKGIIHIIAGLGYEWALNLILDFGVGINFRDVNGWTALHWAARFGREKMVAALVAAGASPVAVTDPTPQHPAGKNPANIAAFYGHEGVAGFLSEAALTSHLSSLTLEESEMSKGSAVVEAEKRVKSLAERQTPVSTIEDMVSLKESLAAAKNVVEAAARIQAAFRVHSFKKRQLREAGFDVDVMKRNDVLVLSAALTLQRAFRSRQHRLNKAALSIQKKYRGWRRRKQFLTLRQSVVKIQACVRGYQARKKYKEIIWTVGILEKVILRWRRRGVGLRGFHVDLESIDETETDDILKVFRKQKVDAVIEEAVSRVLCMVDCPDSRHQYRRMLEKYRQAKAELMGNPNVAGLSSQDGGNMDNGEDSDMYNPA